MKQYAVIVIMYIMHVFLFEIVNKICMLPLFFFNTSLRELKNLTIFNKLEKKKKLRNNSTITTSTTKKKRKVI